MEFAQLQGISYSVSREKAPVYTMGSAAPRAYARNGRGIAGAPRAFPSAKGIVLACLAGV